MICVNVALEHFYGPYDDNTKFVSYIIDNILNNAKKIDLTEGDQERDFIYIDDVVDAFITIMKNIEKCREGFQRYEIGTGQSMKLKNFVKLVKSIVQDNDTVLNFGAIPYRENEVMSSKADITEIGKLKWKPQYTLEEGLLRTISMEKDRIKK